jgi:hypothetical protein
MATTTMSQTTRKITTTKPTTDLWLVYGALWVPGLRTNLRSPNFEKRELMVSSRSSVR